MRLGAGIWAQAPAGARRRDAPIYNRSFIKPSHAHVNPPRGAWMAAPTRISGGLRASQQGNVHVQGLTREQHTTTAIDSAKSQTHSAKTAVFGVFSPNGSAVWPRHHCKLRDHRHQSGGMTPSKHPTRQRHAASELLMMQNPHCHTASKPPGWQTPPNWIGNANLDRLLRSG